MYRQPQKYTRGENIKRAAISEGVYFWRPPPLYRNTYSFITFL
nr:MAG TPA: Geminivirus AL3 protein [Caudoviricetes sp.]